MAKVMDQETFDIYARLDRDRILPLMHELRSALEFVGTERTMEIINILIKDREKIQAIYHDIVTNPYYTEDYIKLDQEPTELAKEVGLQSQGVALMEVLGLGRYDEKN